MIALARKAGFFVLDGLKGGTVRKACRELAKWDRTDAQAPELEAYRKEKLRALMDHAGKTTAHYAGVEKLEFHQLPIINKAIIKDNQKDFLSSVYEGQPLFEMYTSGSTGTPFVSYQDGRKKKKVNAECIYYSRKVGYDVGKPLIYLRAVVRQVTKSRLKQFMQNQPLFNCADLSDSGVEQMLRSIAAVHGKPKTMIAYASTYDAIADYCRRHNTVPKTGLTGLISGAEMLHDPTRQQLRKSFGCKMVSRYSNEENGVLGQDDRQNNVFLINEAHYYIEIMKMDRDEPADPGEVGRVVVTDLFNYAMPMLRYDTGDIGAIELVEVDGIRRRAISQFGGRKSDLITDAKGNRISSFTVTNLLWSFTELKQFQFVQLAKGEYQILVNPAGEFTAEKDLKDALLKLLGEGAKLEVVYVSEIPVLHSGKRQHIVNKMQEVKA